MLLFGTYTWVLTAAMAQKFECVHVVFLQQVIGNKMQRIGDNSWLRVALESVLQVAGTKPIKTYIYKRQATVAEWVDLRPIFGV